MLLSRICVDSDLSEISLEEAMSKCYEKTYTLVVSVSVLKVGVELSRKYKIPLQVETNLPQDAWYVHDKYFGVFSPGA